MVKRYLTVKCSDALVPPEAVAARLPANRQNGFTLIELIMVIVLLGVLAVFVAPRINTTDFDARGFHDETLAFLRYAQKTAIAQRRTVCVVFTLNSATLSVVAAPGNTVCPGVALAGPGGRNPIVPRSAGVAYQALPALPANLFFDSLGQPSVPQVIQVANGGVAIPQTITVEAGTGYVHE